MLSIYGCLQHYKTCSTVNAHNVKIDAEKGFYVPLTSGETGNGVGMVKDVVHQGKIYVLQNAALWRYAFEIIFQVYPLSLISNFLMIGLTLLGCALGGYCVLFARYWHITC